MSDSALVPRMKKQKPSLVRRMWYQFASQLVMAICITTSCIGVCVILLHSTEETIQENARLGPAFRQEINTEQDPVKLRKIANSLEDLTVSDDEIQEKGLRLMIKMSAVFGFGLVAYSSSLGVYAYLLQRQNRKDEASASPQL